MNAALPQGLPHVVVHTDGGCSPNPGPGGWGAILTFGDHEKELKGGEANTTNNRMELMAAISALEALKRPCRVDLHTDSQYLRNGIMSYINKWKQNGWRTADKKPVKNVDLWQRLDAALKPHQVKWHWVKGHSGHEMNERADVLVREAIAEVRSGGKIVGTQSAQAITELVATTHELVRKWAKRTHDELGSGGIFLFGSLIFRGGVQFNDASDVDIVIIFPSHLHDGPRRVDWLQELLHWKQTLEAELFAHLGRKNADKPICSMVAITQIEIAADIHKDGAQNFFSKNQFQDLLSGNVLQGLPDAGKKLVGERLAIECFRFAQKKRNIFLSITASGIGGLAPHENGDPLPKDIMRHGAMVWSLDQEDAPPGAEYDTQQGLDYLSYVLYENRENEPYTTLQNELSVRRGARGERVGLSPKEQLLFTELIFDLTVKHLVDAEARKRKPPRIESTVEFSRRFSRAFPGVRGIAWFDNPNAIKERLELLLQEPLVYSGSQPIWWWRDGNMPIETFRAMEDGIFLMDVSELKVRRIAAVNPAAYDRCFVYVELDPMPPTGLYDKTPERIAEVKGGTGLWSYYWEEYGLVDDGHLVTRAEHDDGAAIINGHPVNILGKNKLRVRYVTPYNFVIAAHGSPINNTKFDKHLAQLLDRMLRGEDVLSELVEAVLKLPKRSDFGAE